MNTPSIMFIGLGKNMAYIISHLPLIIKGFYFYKGGKFFIPVPFIYSEIQN